MVLADPSRTEIDFRVITEGLEFPEGPITLINGDTLLVEIAGKRLTRVTSQGHKETLAELEGGPNGAAIGPDGRVYICNSGGWRYQTESNGIQRTIGQSLDAGWIEAVDLTAGSVERLYTASTNAPLRAPNDIVFDGVGGFWFTDHGKRGPEAIDIGAVYYARPEGGCIDRVISGLITPNGIALSEDGSELYVAETLTRRVLAWPVPAPGRVTLSSWPAPAGGRLVAGLPDTNHLDSMAVDGAGNICVACLIHGGIWVISPDGRERRHLPLPDPMTTNLCFSARGALVTLSGSGRLIELDWPDGGAPVHFSV